MGVVARRSLVLLVVLAVAGLGYLGTRLLSRSEAEECYACNRPIHAHSRTVALANGKSRLFCCPACALSEQRQEGKSVKVQELTAFLTGAKLSPDTAYIVKGSDINMCAQAHELIGEDKRAADVHFDRCAPSLLAFRDRNEANEFSRQHGGNVFSFRDVASSLSESAPAR